jgi:hypothetical protein
VEVVQGFLLSAAYITCCHPERSSGVFAGAQKRKSPKGAAGHMQFFGKCWHAFSGIARKKQKCACIPEEK